MELEEWVKLQNRKVRSNVEIVNLPCAYHISQNPKIKNFVPAIGDWNPDVEDRTIPRVCCSADVLKAISGHAAVAYNSIRDWSNGKMPIFSIYELPFKQYIKPNDKLVYDADTTDEIWVVPYCPDTANFKAPIVGEFTLQKAEDIWVKGANQTVITFVGVTSKEVLIAGDVYIKGGFELVVSTGGKMNDFVPENKYTVDSVRRCSPSVYANTVNSIKDNINGR
ncbi:MAG: hypothetical protein ACRDDY_14160 [Clostridium sp.]|uniref:hypothetical protein n=1 Tax=Clostridium sp. TaxID=1506 RepID=UPI003EE6F853